MSQAIARALPVSPTAITSTLAATSLASMHTTHARATRPTLLTSRMHVGPGTCRCTSSTSLGLRWSTTRLLPVIRVRTALSLISRFLCRLTLLCLAIARAGLTERPEDVELLPFSIVPPLPDVAWTHNTVFVVELLQFAPRTPSRASSSIASCLLAIGLLTPHQTESVSGECRTIDDCEEFINDVARNRDALPYVPGSVQCVRPTTAGLSNSTLSGCAVVRAHPRPSVPAGAQVP
jgi:hypothetical protein